MQWLKTFKIALIEEDEKKLSSLLDNLPSFDKRSDIKSAMEMIAAAKSMLEMKKNKLAAKMQKLEASKKFFESSTNNTLSHNLNIHS